MGGAVPEATDHIASTVTEQRGEGEEREEREGVCERGREEERGGMGWRD